MTCIVRKPDYRLKEVVFVAQRTQACCAQHKVFAVHDIEPEPPCGERSQKVPAGKNQNVTSDRAHMFHYSVCPHSDVAG